MYEAVVFDLDGTLLDTLEDLWRSVNAALRAAGLPARTREEVRDFVGNGIHTLMERATGEVEEETFTRAFEAFKSHYALHCEDNTAPYEGIIPLLQALKARGIRTAVVSNKADFAVKKLSATYFGELVALAVGENEAAGIRKKPAPDSLLAVMKSLGASAENTVYVGDSEVDIQTAKNAGIPCISVAWGFKDEEFLLQNGATRLCREPMEILSEVEGCR